MVRIWVLLDEVMMDQQTQLGAPLAVVITVAFSPGLQMTNRIPTLNLNIC